MRYLYKITNKINGKCYIGQAKDYKSRMSAHKTKKCSTAISYAIQKYGWDNFDKEILGIYEDSVIDIMEVDTIIFYNSIAPNGYNLDSGGCACKSLHETTKQKIRESVKRTNYQHTEDARKRISEGNKGKQLSAAHIEKLRLIHSNRVRSLEERKRFSELQKGKTPWNKGKIMSEEQKIKCSIAHKGKHLSTAHKNKISESNKGKKPTKETIAKWIASRKENKRKNKSTLNRTGGQLNLF